MLLLVVLSMLVLFMLIGTAFLMVSSQSRTASKSAAKRDRVGKFATKDLDWALLQAVRDTENQRSAIRTHSLLNDLYGTGGFEAAVYTPRDVDLNPAQLTRFAEAPPVLGNELGPTQGQMIDIYVRALPWNVSTNASFNDLLTLANENLELSQPDARHVVKVERNLLGNTQLHTLPLIKGYYNGCLLTMTSGPAAGQSTRILDYEFVDNLAGAATANPTRLFRFRVMAFPSKDGRMLQPRSMLTGTIRHSDINQRGLEIAELVHETRNLSGTITDRGGHTFVVNGRPFSGTGVGYNPLAATGQPRLNAEELIQIGSLPPVLAPIALLPNSVYFFATDSNPATPGYLQGMFDRASNLPLNEKIVNGLTTEEIGQRLAQAKYPTFNGTGGANESYDAADFQNMFLGLQSVSPRAMGRVQYADGNLLNGDDVLAFQESNVDQFLRLDLEDLPWPSFHRPDLVNFWYHQLLNNSPWLTAAIPNADARARAILKPESLLASQPDVAAQIMAIKRRIMLRPLAADHPEFTGSNTRSTNPDIQFGGRGAPRLTRGDNIAVPYWEAVGPWDVDNDNDGVADSVWVDIGNPVMEAEDGTRYKAIVSYLIVDMDSKLNVNAHGLAEHIWPPIDDAAKAAFDPTFDNLAHDPAIPAAQQPRSSLALPRGLGYSPAEINLRPLLPAPLNGAGSPTYGNRTEGNPIDSYATLLSGRLGGGGKFIVGRNGLDLNQGNDFNNSIGVPYDVAPGATSASPALGTIGPPGMALQFKFVGYPWMLSQYAAASLIPTSFATPPDLGGRYALGVTHSGQPFYEFTREPLDRPMLADSALALDLTSSRRRDVRDDQLLVRFNPGVGPTGQTEYVDSTGTARKTVAGMTSDSDDAPFSTADLERILRRSDADAGSLESRLYDVVDAFDPDKLIQFDPNRVSFEAQRAFGSTSEPEVIAAAESMAAVNSRLVTTDSWSLPVPGGNFMSRLLYGDDGQPGKAGVDDDNANGVDDPGEYGWGGSDDWHALMGGGTFDNQGRPTTPVTRPQSATLVDYLMYRIQRERSKIVPPVPLYTALDLKDAAAQLLAPEVIAGQRMDINRPFGNGRDDNNNGIVDEPMEAGEPYVVDANGALTAFIDLDGDTNPTPSVDKLWQGLVSATGVDFDYTNGQGNPVYGGGRFVRNLESHGRQLYARHLYCLMLLLVDDGYVAPLDADADLLKGDPQIVKFAKTWRDAGLSNDQIKRKLTCRAIAQWAINCVDARDSDAIMTPFEYDENPWDGWGVLDGNNVNIPLDGDLATDENNAEGIDWNQAPQKVVGPIAGATAPIAVNKTRGIVWGAERPELLINETIAFHDRRSTWPPVNDQNGNETDTLKQQLKPQGSVFIELVNPWSNEGALPTELYRYPAVGGNQPQRHMAAANTPVDGVLLHRQSDLQAPKASNFLGNEPGFSPVWRLSVVRQNKPELQANSKYGASWNEVADGLPGSWERRTGNSRFRRLNPDLADFDSDRDAERWVYFAREPREQIYTYYQGGWQNFRGTASASANTSLLRIPSVPAKLDGATGQRLPLGRNYFLALDATPNSETDLTKVFSPILPGQFAVIGSAGTQYPGLAQLSTGPVPRFITTIGRVMMPSSRTGLDPEDHHIRHVRDGSTRRIELLPRPNPLLQQILIAKNGGPEWVMRNGQMVNVADPASYVAPNTAPLNPAIAIPISEFNVSEPVEGYIHSFVNARFTDREGQARKPYRDLYQGAINTDGVRRLIKNTTSGELQFVQTGSTQLNPFTIPLDMDYDLVRNGTTANYRTIHLQRLANPMLPWNPMPKLADNKPHPDYNPALAINPYLTIDSAGVDCTAFNGVDESERTALPVLARSGGGQSGKSDLSGYNLQRTDNPAGLSPPGAVDWHAIKRHMPFSDTATGTQLQQGQFFQRLHLKSLERGSHNYSVLKPAPGELDRVSRTMWDQEREDRKAVVQNGTAGARTEGDNYPNSTDVVDHNYWIEAARTGTADPNWLRVVPGAAISQRRTAAMSPTSGDLVDVLYSGERRKQLEGRVPAAVIETMISPPVQEHVIDYVMEQTLGFPNVAQGPLNLRTGATDPAQLVGTPKIDRNATIANKKDDSTYPWLAWNDRPFVSAEELLNVPAASSAALLRPSYFSTINPLETPAAENSPYANDGWNGGDTDTFRANLPFGHLLSFFAADSKRSGTPPHFYRILEYVQVPSRFVGTDTMLQPELFNAATGVNDPRLNFQPPFNKVSRQRDPGRVNLNTVMGRRIPATTSSPPFIWSDIYDGIMHRHRNLATGAGDGNLLDSSGRPSQVSHPGPAWRDVVLSRRGYAQIDAGNNFVDKPPVPTGVTPYPDTFSMGLNSNFPTVFANPFRSSDAGDLVPVSNMVQNGVDASWLRGHPRTRGDGGLWGMGAPAVDDNGVAGTDEPDEHRDFLAFFDNDPREAGFGNDALSMSGDGAIPQRDLSQANRETTPLFSDTTNLPSLDPDRNPYMRYQPLTRIGNLVTNRSNVYAVWITVGYFEVKPAPSWSDPAVQAKFGGLEALYNRVYPDGYQLGAELGSDTGNVTRPRGFYIIDRSVPVGFKPGEDLNVEKTIRVQRRIE